MEIVVVNSPPSDSVGPEKIDFVARIARSPDALMKADWDRFRHYTQRVRSVNLENVWEMEELPLNSAALIRMFHGVSAILPNVKEISWSFWNPDNSPAVIPFLGPQLEKLCLNTYPWMDTTAHEQVQLFQSLTGHIQSLRSLEIASLSPVRCPKTLATLIGSCPNLRLLDLPPYYLTKEVVAAAARLPHLEILYCDVSPGTERNYTGLGMEFEFTANSFPQLKKASFAAFPLRMAEIFQAPAHIANLEAVDLNCPLDGSTEEIKTIFANLAAGAPMLQDIRLVCTPIRQLQATSGFESLSIDTISPLFSCTYLTDFILLAPCFRPLTAEDLIQMGKSWPRISSLGICPTPLVDDYPGTDINLLSAFAQSFPLLNELISTNAIAEKQII
ncbi:hypothetical protein FRB90_000345 [Tulasnella sp. 427]|nr:hypothetical protein FRB90_000345 [Tulasnella sp. 427]